MTASLAQTTDRRKLLTTGLAAGLLAASGLSITARPQVGGRFRAALPGASLGDSWDARKGFGLFMAAAGQGAVFDNLTEVAADGSLRGELATGWHASRDAKTWIFDLRSGVKFHNGATFDSASVIESIRLHMDAGERGAGWHLVSNIDTIKANSPTQVQFSLHAGNADFPYLLSDRHLIVYPAGNIAEAMRQGIGTGLYRVAKFDAGQRFVGWRVSGHYKDGTAGWFDQVEFLSLDDASQRLAALQSGRVDAVAEINPAETETVLASSAMRLSSIPGNQHIALDTSNISNNDVRLAFKSAIDRENVLLSGLYGYGHVGHDSPLGPFNQQYQTGNGANFDPDRSLFRLKQGGYESFGLNIDLGKGVPSTLGAAIWPSLMAGGFANSLGPTIKARLWSGRPTEDWMLSANTALGGNSAEFESLRLEALSELDPARRAELYGDLQGQMKSSGPVVIPVFANFLHAVSTRVAEPLTQGNLWPMDNARFAERWWLS